MHTVATVGVVVAVLFGAVVLTGKHDEPKAWVTKLWKDLAEKSGGE